MLQILNKANFDRLCTKEGFEPIRRAMNVSQELAAPRISRVESEIINPLDVLFTKQNWHNRGVDLIHLYQS